MPSPDYHRQRDLRILQKMIPHDAPIVVSLDVAHRLSRFTVKTLDGQHTFTGRYQVVMAWIEGYVASFVQRV